MKYNNLEELFRSNYPKVIDYSLRIEITGIKDSIRDAEGSIGTVKFYIHPAYVGGETMDFSISGDKLINLFPLPNLGKDSIV